MWKRLRKERQAVEAQPVGALSVPLAVRAVGAVGPLTLTWPHLEVPDGWALTLADAVTGETVDVRTATEVVFTEAVPGRREAAWPRVRPPGPTPAAGRPGSRVAGCRRPSRLRATPRPGSRSRPSRRT